MQWLNRRNLTAMTSPASTWEHFLDIIIHRFVPPYYLRGLLVKLQRLSQGRRSVEEYACELEVLMHDINTRENKQAKITRFISGLNRNIQNVVELHDHEILDIVVHRAMKVEKQILRKTSSHNKFSTSSKRCCFINLSNQRRKKRMFLKSPFTNPAIILIHTIHFPT